MKNVLLVIKNAKLRFQIRNTLSMNMFHPIAANNYVEAIQLAQEQYPEFIITDLDVFQNDDYEILKQLRELTLLNQIPILLLNNQIDHNFCLKVWQLGITLFLPQPLNPDLIVKLISEQLKQAS
ncbi:MAG: hypothetical protein Kow0049_15430 [Stanieria sp.]